MFPTSQILIMSRKIHLFPFTLQDFPKVCRFFYFSFIFLFHGILFFDFFCWCGSGAEVGKGSFKPPKFLVIGHRGNGMNLLQSTDRRMKAVKENTILSFNTAGNFPVDFIEFDVQVNNFFNFTCVEFHLFSNK